MLTEDSDLRQLLSNSRVIAVVGLSDNPQRPSNRVAAYLIEAGYTVVPVNPARAEILGLKCYPNLRAVPERIDIVDVFRRSEDVLPVAEEAVAVGAGALWLQEGVISPEAVALAEAAGLKAVMDRCTAAEHMRLFAGVVACAVNPGQGRA
ncbi:MAG: CoA-binding protein [Azoarcus sp.]|jgi:predicted CoA-binding protein|nr:CoA-binding protein [Azoarcus sp.]